MTQSTPTFMPAIVVDYIKKPFQTDDEANEYLSHLNTTVGVSLPDGLVRLKNAPKGSIIGRLINSNTVAATVFYPFFSHISMPVKSGEVVWVIDNHPIGFWLSRKTSDRIAEDPNFTHGPRALNSIPLVDKVGDTKSIQKTFNVDPAQIVDYRRVFDNSRSNQATFLGEAVPRFFAHSPDLSFEGSNNALVVLGSAGSLGDKRESAGMIDIVVGRGQTPSTSPTDNFVNGRNFTENDKTAQIKDNEGNIDLKNDLSSVYVAMNDNLDSQFGISIGSNQGAGPSAGLRSNHIRLSAREDIKITVESSGSKIGIVIKDGTVTITNGTGAQSTDVIVDGAGLQRGLAAALTELAVLPSLLGITTLNTKNLINRLLARNFSSKVTKSD